ncbi:MAG: hypothetical protein QNJ63_26195 [Calothrix sp. MO_192.B10]|nr:hypothetical protein [Calothrix sp. MO_192.B10]
MLNKKAKQPIKINQLQDLSYLELLSDEQTYCVEGGEYTILPYPDPFHGHDRFFGGGPCIGEIPPEYKNKSWSGENIEEVFRKISKYVMCPPSSSGSLDHSLGL